MSNGDEFSKSHWLVPGLQHSHHEIGISLCEHLESQPLPQEPSPFLLIDQSLEYQLHLSGTSMVC